MSKEASQIGRIVSRVTDPEDLAELVRTGKSEVALGVASLDSCLFDRGVAIYEAASAALGNASVRTQLPRYTQAA